jgi:hypothetical protein
LVEFSAKVLAELAMSYLSRGYHLGDQPLPRGCVVAVYGRYSVQLAQRLADVVERVSPRLLVVSGNKGKDSGPLVTYGIPEAHYLLSAADVLTRGVVLLRTELAIDLTATKGTENAERMVELMLQQGYGSEEACDMCCWLTRCRCAGWG